MPASGRRKTRNAKDVELPSEADAADITNTPSRKKRRLNGGDDNAAVAQTASVRSRRLSAQSDETIENHNGEEDNEDTNAYALAEEVIQHLKVAAYEVAVAIDHNNRVVEQSATAYAKIAGRTWTFYVADLSVIIGRPNAKPKGQGPGVDYAIDEQSTNDMRIDIDLGPDQQISRLHAEISYDGKKEQWFILVTGRNGLTVDELRIERGQRKYLSSGNIINVLGTQMMFMLPNKPPIVNASIRKTLLREGEEEEEDEVDAPEEKPTRSFARGGRGRAANSFQASSHNQPAPQDDNNNNNGAAVTIQNAVPSSSQQEPGTPVTRQGEQPQPKSKPSPAYSRGIMLESTEQIDYGADSARDIKPPHSYAQIIGQAIMSTAEEKITLAKIYEFIKEKYAYFRFGGGGWQNSIRHNLSLSKHFEKIPRRTDEPGKGMKWQIVPEHRAEYMKKNFHEKSKVPRQIGSSGPSSPSSNRGPSVQTERLMGALGETAHPDSLNFQPSPRSTTPPLISYPAPNESFTPDRGPRSGNTNAYPLSMNGTTNVSAISTPPHDRGMVFGRHSALSHPGPSGSGRGGLNELAIDSPPTLTGNQYDGPGAANLFTPMPARHIPKLGVHSTIKPPSFYAKELFSSPAPFWKYVEVGSTPAKPPTFDDLSPEKKAAEDEEPDIDDEDDGKGEGEADGDETLLVKTEGNESARVDTDQSSSPSLPIAVGASSGGEGPDESPSRTISRPGSRREATIARKGLDPIPVFAVPAQQKLGLTPTSAGPAFNPYAAAPADEEEEDGIDLAKGFQKIGSFHRSMQATASSFTN